MRYVGGKARHARRIVDQLPAGDILVEPFGGGAWATAEAARSGKFQTIKAFDLNGSIPLFWTAILEGWEPPGRLTRDEYEDLRYAEDSALRAWAGVCHSYVGKWFGGYGPESSGRDYVAEGYRSVMRKRDAMRECEVVWEVGSYEAVPLGDVTYCDPPYANSEGYKGAPGEFNTPRFWRWAEARGAYVTEFVAPDGWRTLDEWGRPATMHHGGPSKPRRESLFAPPGPRR